MHIKNKNIYESQLKTLSMILAGLLFTAGCSNLKDDPGEGRRTPLPEYTEHNAREWTAVSPEHLPVISFTVKQGTPYIRVQVPLKNPSESHYIEKIGIYNKISKEVLAEKAFSRTDRIFEADFPYDYNDAEIKVFVKCNLHDLWTVEDPGRFR